MKGRMEITVVKAWLNNGFECHWKYDWWMVKTISCIDDWNQVLIDERVKQFRVVMIGLKVCDLVKLWTNMGWL